MNEGRPLTQEEIKSMKIKDGDLLKEGAEIDNMGRLEATEKQVLRAHEEMDNNILYQKMRDILPSDEHLELAKLAFAEKLRNDRSMREEDKKVYEDLQQIFGAAFDGRNG